MPLLEIENLTVEFKTGSGLFRAVDGVSLRVDSSELVGGGLRHAQDPPMGKT